MNNKKIRKYPIIISIFHVFRYIYRKNCHRFGIPRRHMLSPLFFYPGLVLSAPASREAIANRFIVSRLMDDRRAFNLPPRRGPRARGARASLPFPSSTFRRQSQERRRSSSCAQLVAREKIHLFLVDSIFS